MDIRTIINDHLSNASYYKPETGKSAGTRSTTNTQMAAQELSSQEIGDLVDRLNNTIRNSDERISFSFHEKTRRIIVKFINQETNEVIREIPSKDAIRLLEHLQDYLGMLVDESR